MTAVAAARSLARALQQGDFIAGHLFTAYIDHVVILKLILEDGITRQSGQNQGGSSGSEDDGAANNKMWTERIMPGCS